MLDARARRAEAGDVVAGFGEDLDPVSQLLPDPDIALVVDIDLGRVRELAGARPRRAEAADVVAVFLVDLDPAGVGVGDGVGKAKGRALGPKRCCACSSLMRLDGGFKFTGTIVWRPTNTILPFTRDF